jgi:hypothetical protein
MSWAVKKKFGFFISKRVVGCFIFSLPLSLLCAWLAGMLDVGILPSFLTFKYRHIADLGLKTAFFPACWGASYYIYMRVCNSKTTFRTP